MVRKYVKGDRVQIGVIGAGRIANTSHLPVLTKLPDAKVVAISDICKARAEETAKRFSIPRIYEDFAQMLEQERLDLVDILTPPNTHIELALCAMEHDLHCLIEKPLALSVAEASKLVEMAEHTGLTLHVVHNWSFFPERRRAKLLVESGVVGRVVSVDVQYLTDLQKEYYIDPNHWCHRLPGGVFADILPHLVMLLLDYLGKLKVVNVLASKCSSDEQLIADELRVFVRSSDAIGSIHISLNSPVRRLWINIVGTKASILVKGEIGTFIIYKPVKNSTTVWSMSYGIPRGMAALREIFQEAFGLASVVINAVLGQRTYLDGHKYLITRSITNLRGHGEYPISSQQSLEAVKVLETILMSL